jgi:UDP-N-acetyl-D-galactosamine dehydrogenase
VPEKTAGSTWQFLAFRPGIVAGHCIGEHSDSLTHKAKQVGDHPQVILAGRRIHYTMGRHAARPEMRSSVGVLGVTFEYYCPDIRNSKVADLVRDLEGCGGAEGWYRPAGKRWRTSGASAALPPALSNLTAL